MKKCMSCDSEINNEAVFCTKCGAKQPEPKVEHYCPHCGIKLNEGVKYCYECGCATSLAGNNTPQYTSDTGIHNKEDVLNTLAEKERVSGAFWLIIASFQFILLIYFWSTREAYTIYTSRYNSSLSTEYVITILFLAAVCVLNIIGGITSMRISQIAHSNPNWFSSRYMKAGRYVGAIIYNGLLLLEGLNSGFIYTLIISVFAVGISIYDLAGVRSYAVSHSNYFQRMEASIGKR